MKHQPIDHEFEALVRSQLTSYASAAPTEVRDAVDTELRPVAPDHMPKRRIVGIGASAIALLGGLTLTGIAATGGDDGGSNTPEEAVQDFVQAIENRDVLGALDVLDPGESGVLVDAVGTFVGEGRRVGLFDDSVDPSDVEGAGITVDGLHTSTDQLATDLAVVTLDSGTAQLSFDPASLPFSDRLRAQAGDAAAEAGQTIDFAESPLRLATVERDGIWYVSAGYSIAEAARTSAGLSFPDAATIAPEGFDFPEAAVTSFWDRVAALDIDGLIATAAPGETDALARYAPLWVPDVTSSAAAATASGTTFSISDMGFEVSGDGDRRRVEPTTYVIDGTVAPVDHDVMPVFDPTQPTMVWATQVGTGFYLIDAGEPIPDDFDGLEFLEEFPEDIQSGDVNPNTANLLPDGSLQKYWTDSTPAATDQPRPFHVEFADGCTVSSGALVDDARQWGGFGTVGLDDLGNGRYQSCGSDASEPFGINSVFALLYVGSGGVGVPQLPAVQTVEVDGQWYISPVGTIGLQVFDVLEGVSDGGILSIDSPIASYIYGADRALLESQLATRPAADIGADCAAIVTTDGTGIVDGIIDDPAASQVRACVYSDGLFGGPGVTGDQNVIDESVPASTNAQD